MEQLDPPAIPDSHLADLTATLPRQPFGEPPYYAPAFEYRFPWEQLGKLACQQGGMPKGGEWEPSNCRDDDCPVREALRNLLVQEDPPYGIVPEGKQPLSLLVAQIAAVWEDQEHLPGYVEPAAVLLIEALVALRKGRLGLPVATGPGADAAGNSLETTPSGGCCVEDVGGYPRGLESEAPRILELAPGGTGLPGIAAARLFPDSKLLFADSEFASWESLRENAEMNDLSCEGHWEYQRLGGIASPVVGFVPLHRLKGTEVKGASVGTSYLLKQLRQRWGGVANLDLVLCANISHLGASSREASATLAALLPEEGRVDERLALVAHKKSPQSCEEAFFRALASLGLSSEMVLEQYEQGIGVYVVRRTAPAPKPREAKRASLLLRREDHATGGEFCFWSPPRPGGSSPQSAQDAAAGDFMYSPFTDIICAAHAW
eukprot:TRINITY_DN38694_c0_g1_i1.p1 TRINITY_DN38694_c0_g1~~TRINITY_DN38694_c0_g1_i1.p1  ORF type:complete len:433 (-),score=88.52 TRINITY_DN38694_c0_g1_i1:131-1429(-)